MVRLLGSRGSDVQLAGLLREEFALLCEKHAAAGAGAAAPAELEEKLRALLRRCERLMREYPDDQDALRDIVASATDGEHYATLRFSPDIELKAAAITAAPAATAAAAPAADENPAAAGLTRAERDAAAIKMLQAFYAQAKPDKDAKEVPTIWSQWKWRPQDLRLQLIKRYPKYTHLIGWLQDIPAAPKPEEPAPKADRRAPTSPAAPQRGRQAERGREATPAGKPPATPNNQKTSAKRSSSAMKTIFGMVASPVVKLFGRADDEDMPAEAILPDQDDDGDFYYDAKLGRWVFPKDIEGEKERAKLDAAKNGPPPPPGGGVKKAAGGGVSGGYLDSFNTGDAAAPPPMMRAPVPGYVDPFNTQQGGAAAPAPPPKMPPMPTRGD